MTNYLLDTHVVIWLMFDVEKIPKNTLQKIKNPDNEIYISAVSFWEISMKYKIGKLDLNKFVPSELPQIYLDQGFQQLSISINETSSFYELSSTYHRDPFDRMLIWQAIQNNLILISNDENMSLYRSEGLKLLW